MSAATVLRWKAGAALLTSALWLGAAGDTAQEEKQGEKQEAKKEGGEKKASEKREPEITEFRLTVTVVVGEAASASPVNRANVTLFYGTDTQGAPTGSDGRVSFRFSTAARTATVRVRADKFNPYQTTLTLVNTEMEHRAVLTDSN